VNQARRALAAAAALGAAMASEGQAQTVQGDAARGAQIYARVCSACHSPDQNRIGPMHRGVYGRRAGRAPGFRYSAALARLNVVWNGRTLDRWLADPTRTAPGTAMGVRVGAAQDRADVIAYLRTLSAAPSSE
jgi:cytochrome c